MAKMSTADSSADDNFDDKQDLREQQRAHGKDHLNENDDEENQTPFDNMDEMDVQVRQSMAAGGQQLFSRNKVQASLQDFEIRKLIGKGTFGKVFLVEHA